MTTGIRGANPIWLLVDLEGNIVDDTCFMFVLENTIPYAPLTVYRDPDLNVPWTNPIQFLSNGTLPDNIYFTPGVVYRLEFRRGNTQQDPLIAQPVENYAPGGTGEPPDTVTFPTSNQITNPQFSLLSFVDSIVVVSETNPAPIQVAPGWFLDLAGTGSATITRVALNNANANPSNAPYALRINVNGWNSGGVILRQRMQQNGMLWANKTVSTAITARIEGVPQTISALLVDSNGTLLAEVLESTSISQEFEEYTSYGQLGATTNPNTPPSAYIDYKLLLPNNGDIYVTSIQLVVQDTQVLPTFEQDTIDRQIDHTYHTAHPIYPVGALMAYNGFDVPEHFLHCGGSAISRTTYNLLFNVMTKVETVTLTSGLTTFTSSNAFQLRIGAPLEGTGIQAGTTIANIVGTTIVMSLVATFSGNSAVRFFVNGNGNGLTTFNLPDWTGRAIAGAFGSIFGSGLNGVGSTGGASSVILSTANLPQHVHTYDYPTFVSLFAPGVIAGLAFAPQSRDTGGGPGTSTPFSIVQQTGLANICIRYE